MPCARAMPANDTSATHNAQYLFVLVMTLVPRRIGSPVLVLVRRALPGAVLIPFLDRQPFVVVALPAAEILEELQVRRRVLRRRRGTRRWRVAASSSRTLASHACFAPRSNSLNRSDSVRRSFMPMLLAVLSEQLAQSVHGARVMCLHAPFGAVHRERGLRDVESLEIAHRERLALPRRQYRERLLERLHRVVREHPV